MQAIFDVPSSPIPVPNNLPGPMDQSSPRPPEDFDDDETPDITDGTDQLSALSSPPLHQASYHQKHPSEDFSQLAGSLAKKHKLKDGPASSLIDFAKLPLSQQNVYLFCEVMRIRQQQDTLHPPDIVFIIPKKLEAKIEIYIFRTLMSPSLASYVQKPLPTDIVTALIKKHPSWGVTPEVKDNKSSWDVVVKWVRERLTDWCYDIKKVLSKSIWTTQTDDNGVATLVNRTDPLDIIDLCTALVGIFPGAQVPVTVPMLGRVAVLRQVLVNSKGATKFWEKVDNTFVKLRSDHNNDKTAISKLIGRALKNDHKVYGEVDVTHVPAGDADDVA
ncbi:hypothetical protein BDZ94DRAFT_1245129 [Collybia nuda]|uniref:Uncharacterized protein n=1 Tax=Collybia nuda TaxID=64659 RepID=A0A9P6CP77_9AGAR|nr:hypothetical protein BDZ94DRAFT_1245129 [Collybia nuda]